MTNPIRKVFNKVGIDIRKYRQEIDKKSWFAELNIKTVLDIGANTGQFAAEIRSSLPDAFIYSFEPLQDCYLKLQENMKNDPKFKCFNFAIGEKDGETTINRSSYTPSSSLLKMSQSHKNLFPHTAGEKKETIKVKTLDGILSSESLQKNVLIKIDTQGYEDRVIRGGINTFNKATLAIIESSFISLYDDQPLFKDIYSQMTALGFTYKGALQQKIDPKNGRILFEDSIYERTN